MDTTKKIEKLEEENKVLKELNVCVGCEDNPTYKARIDKAINFINHAVFMNVAYKEGLLNILEDKE